MINTRDFYINGAWVKPLVANDLGVINPSTEEVCATISLGSAADCDRAVSAAKAAFPGWAATSPAERRRYVTAILAQYERRAEEMAQAIGSGQNMGVMRRVFCLRRSADHRELRPL